MHAKLPAPSSVQIGQNCFCAPEQRRRFPALQGPTSATNRVASTLGNHLAMRMMERSSWSRVSSWMSARTEAAQSSSAATPHRRERMFVTASPRN